VNEEDLMEAASNELNTAIEAAVELKVVYGWSVDEIITNIKTAIEGVD
jgi:hypothetical protein